MAHLVHHNPFILRPGLYLLVYLDFDTGTRFGVKFGAISMIIGPGNYGSGGNLSLLSRKTTRTACKGGK